MDEVTPELIYRQIQAGHDELKDELASMREEQARTNEKVAAIARWACNLTFTACTGIWKRSKIPLRF
jgi:hypothetical protein